MLHICTNECSALVVKWLAHWHVGSLPTLGAIFPIFMTPMTLVAMSMIPNQLFAVWLEKPTLFIYKYGHWLHVCICKH